MKLCSKCGLGIKESNGVINCLKYKNPQEDKESCMYYIKIVYEEGEPLSPLEHLLLKEKDINSRKMKGGIGF